MIKSHITRFLPIRRSAPQASEPGRFVENRMDDPTYRADIARLEAENERIGFGQDPSTVEEVPEPVNRFGLTEAEEAEITREREEMEAYGNPYADLSEDFDLMTGMPKDSIQRRMESSMARVQSNRPQFDQGHVL